MLLLSVRIKIIFLKTLYCHLDSFHIYLFFSLFKTFDNHVVTIQKKDKGKKIYNKNQMFKVAKKIILSCDRILSMFCFLFCSLHSNCFFFSYSLDYHGFYMEFFDIKIFFLLSQILMCFTCFNFCFIHTHRLDLFCHSNFDC